MNLRSAFLPPVLDLTLVTRLAKLADRLDGPPSEESEKLLAKFNRLAGVAMESAEFRGFNGATDPESFVRDILYRKSLVPDPDLTREEMAEIVERVIEAGPDHEFYIALFCVNCKHPSMTDLLYYPDQVPGLSADPTNAEIADCALGWEPRVVAMQVAERRGGNSVEYYIYTLTAPATPSTQVVTGLDEKYEKGTVLAVALKGMQLRDGTIVKEIFPHRIMSCGKILGKTDATLGSRLE